MPWYFYVAHFIAGAFLANSVPHLVQGVCGNRFPTPFGSPHGVGESGAVVNVLWSFFNLGVGGAVLHYFFPPALPPPLSLCAAGFLGALATALWLAMHFSRVRNAPPPP